jgi:hypothetical protein
MNQVVLLRVMKSLKFWEPVIISLIATPICLFISVVSTGGGHSFVLPKTLFPYAMLSAFFFRSVANSGVLIVLTVLLAGIEIPFYGVVLGAASAKNKFLLVAAIILVTHVLAVIACFLFINDF